MTSTFHLVIATKYLDVHGPSQIKAEKAEGALEIARARFKSHDDGGKVAHFRLFASADQADKYAGEVQKAQKAASDYRKSALRLAGTPDEWIARKMKELARL